MGGEWEGAQVKGQGDEPRVEVRKQELGPHPTRGLVPRILQFKTWKPQMILPLDSWRTNLETQSPGLGVYSISSSMTSAESHGFETMFRGIKRLYYVGILTCITLTSACIFEVPCKPSSTQNHDNPHNFCLFSGCPTTSTLLLFCMKHNCHLISTCILWGRDQQCWNRLLPLR